MGLVRPFFKASLGFTHSLCHVKACYAWIHQLMLWLCRALCVSGNSPFLGWVVWSEVARKIGTSGNGKQINSHFPCFWIFDLSYITASKAS